MSDDRDAQQVAKHDARQIAAWPREVCSETRSDWIGDAEKNDRDCAGLALQRRRDGGRHCEDDLRLQRDQLLRKRLVLTRIRSGKAMLDLDGADGIVELRARVSESDGVIISVFASVHRSFCWHNLAGIATLD